MDVVVVVVDGITVAETSAAGWPDGPEMGGARELTSLWRELDRDRE